MKKLHVKEFDEKLRHLKEIINRDKTRTMQVDVL